MFTVLITLFKFSVNDIVLETVMSSSLLTPQCSSVYDPILGVSQRSSAVLILEWVAIILFNNGLELSIFRCLSLGPCRNLIS